MTDDPDRERPDEAVPVPTADPDLAVAQADPVEAADGPPVYLTPPPPDPVPDEPAPAPAAPARRGRTGPVLVVVAVAAIAGLGYYAAQRDVFGLRAEPDTTALTAIEARIAALEAATPQDARVPALADQVAALAPLSGQVAEQVAALEARLAKAEADLAAVAAIPADGSVSAATVAALAAEVAALQAQGAAEVSPEAVRAAVQQELAAWEADAAARLADQQAQAQAAAAQAAAGLALRQALDTGAPYAEALAALPEPHPEVLAQHAATGLPSLSALQEGFPAAARAALDAALRATGGDGMTDRFWTFLRLQTGARSTEARDGTDPDAILSRAEAALASGDVTAALAELATLPPEAQAALADWTAQADLHLAARAALAALFP